MARPSLQLPFEAEFTAIGGSAQDKNYRMATNICYGATTVYVEWRYGATTGNQLTFHDCCYLAAQMFA
jgi:hypothetical protein